MIYISKNNEKKHNRDTYRIPAMDAILKLNMRAHLQFQIHDLNYFTGLFKFSL